ncbi:8447_t:CDS:2, partial [Scutellospora calospora]
MGNKISIKITKKLNKKKRIKFSSSKNETLDSANSSNSRLTSNLRIVDGRPYFDEDFSMYMFPIDWEEADRIQALHFVLKHILGGNYSAPLSNIIKPGSKILDIGCGPGHCLETSQEFTNAEFYGIDLISTFPDMIKPPNCYFQTCNILDGLPFDDNEFDYIFMRHMLTIMKKSQWNSVLKDIMRVMKPGGVIESVELNLI